MKRITKIMFWISFYFFNYVFIEKFFTDTVNKKALIIGLITYFFTLILIAIEQIEKKRRV